MAKAFPYFRPNAIYRGDCKEVLAQFSNECVDLIYLDPPFFSNKPYEVIWGDDYERRVFDDRWKGGIQNYIDWMKPALQECYRVLKDTGALFLHIDWHASHYLKVELDNIFGRDNFRNEISVKRIRKNVHEYEMVKRLNTAFDSILFYAKSDKHRIKPPMRKEHKPARRHAFDANGLRTGMDYDLFGHKPPVGGHWRWTKERAQKAIKDGILRPNPKSGKPEYLIPESTHTIVTSVWDDIKAYSFKTKYPTEKSEELLTRIIAMSSNPMDIVLDPFCGCGTAIAAAHTLGRQWIGIDVSPTACDVMKKRMTQLGAKDVLLIGMPMNEIELRKLAHFDFQKWIVERVYGMISQRKSGDMGIDGYTEEGYPIQVKQSDDVGRNVVDNFETAMRRRGAKKGVIIAFSFGKGAYEEAARAKRQDGIEIKPITVRELLRNRRRLITA